MRPVAVVLFLAAAGNSSSPPQRKVSCKALTIEGLVAGQCDFTLDVVSQDSWSSEVSYAVSEDGGAVVASCGPSNGCGDIGLLFPFAATPGASYSLTAGDSFGDAWQGAELEINQVGVGLFFGPYTLTAAFSEVTSLGVLCTVGGGGDPHLWAPALPQPRFDLAGSAAITAGRSVGAFDVILLQSNEVTVTGHVRASPLDGEKFYFTSFSIETEEDEAFLSFHEDEGIALASLQHGGDAASCSSTSDRTTSLEDRAFLALHCSDGEARAARSAFETSRFSSHIPFVTASFDLETAHFSIEFFFVQKEGPSFGFFDFSVQYHTDDVLEGIFTNQAAAMTHARNDGSDNDTMMLASSRRVSALLNQHVAFVE